MAKATGVPEPTKPATTLPGLLGVPTDGPLAPGQVRNNGAVAGTDNPNAIPGIKAADLGEVVTLPNGKQVAIFGDSYGNPAVGGPGSPHYPSVAVPVTFDKNGNPPEPPQTQGLGTRVGPREYLPTDEEELLMARTPLHQAAVRGTRESVQETIDEGFDVNEADADGLTPLHMASINKNYNTAKALLEAGAHVDTQDRWGNTPLWRAVFGKDGTVELIELLIDHGADPAIENESGNSPMNLARRLQKSDYLAVFERTQSPDHPRYDRPNRPDGAPTE